jgi:cyclopropane fatty-acyl-phospholipid synthase-like methyltransferase
MAGRFDTVTGIDIAPTMLKKLSQNCAKRGVSNVAGMLASDRWDRDEAFDFAYTRIVLQHIESWDEISSYFQRVAKSLTPEGAFYVQFDTRPATWLYRLRNHLPDAILPRTYHRGVRRIRRRGHDVLALADSNGLRLAIERGRHTLDHELVFLKSA